MQVGRMIEGAALRKYGQLGQIVIPLHQMVQAGKIIPTVIR
jgi:hypothetical protein